MLENLLTNVERDNFNLSRFGESQSNKRIVNREWLQRLERIKIVTESLVGEIQTRPDYRHASYRSSLQALPGPSCRAARPQCRSSTESSYQPRCRDRETRRERFESPVSWSLSPSASSNRSRIVFCSCTTRRRFSRTKVFVFSVPPELFRMDTAASENVSQKNETLVVSRIAQCFRQDQSLAPARPASSKSCIVTTRGCVVNEVPNKSRLIMESSAPCSRRARTTLSSS